PVMSSTDQAKIKAAMAKLSPDDQQLAQAQVFCAIDQDSPLGSMGPILKEMIKGQPVSLCCKGCVAEAKAHPDETLLKLKQVMAQVAPKKAPSAKKRLCSVEMLSGAASGGCQAPEKGLRGLTAPARRGVGTPSNNKRVNELASCPSRPLHFTSPTPLVRP